MLVPRRAGVEDQRHDVAELSTAGERAVTGTLQLQYASRHRRANALREGLSDRQTSVVRYIGQSDNQGADEVSAMRCLICQTEQEADCPLYAILAFTEVRGGAADVERLELPAVVRCNKRSDID